MSEMSTSLPAPAASGGALALDQLISRIMSILEEEKLLLEAKGFSKLQESSERKAWCLLELNRALRSLPWNDYDDVAHRLTSLRAKLSENARLLQLHLEAARSIGAIITQVLEDNQSDGTYSSIRRASR